jgi:hypothetical protein
MKYKIACGEILRTTRYMTPLPGGRFALRGHFASASTLQQNVSYIGNVDSIIILQPLFSKTFIPSIHMIECSRER